MKNTAKLIEELTNTSSTVGFYLKNQNALPFAQINGIMYEVQKNREYVVREVQKFQKLMDAALNEVDLKALPEIATIEKRLNGLADLLKL